ncbi:hypothetical protein D8674_041360 [Pyrus ussuriensis x Pyrus communis]|uniref:Uncharacterized protein n=1 Tax=Pyrus ussuriensis x Pyrus communis TaxID=2448454 RepID=A0A5N5GHN3_9ROSA|nr:hypothetical protein D8674_041360 [Pyrus ussuriensis x Pyrus communis]
MRVVALLFVVMMASSCLAAPRRAIGKERGKAMQKNSAKYPGSSLANHHNIPRQYYNDPNGGDGEGDNW